MKKFLSMLLVLVLTLSMGTVAFAVEESKNPTLTVTYKLDDTIKDAAGLKAPDQIFTYTFTKKEVKQSTTVTTTEQMPTIDSVNVEFKGNDVPTTGDASNSKTKTVTIDLSQVQWPGVGEYYYTVTQSVDQKALGVEYYNADNTLKVTVAQDTTNNYNKYYVAFVTLTSNLDDVNENGVTTNKTNGFTNTYTANNLSVKKEVTGNMGDRTKEFEVDIKFTVSATEGAPGMLSSITYNNGSEVTIPTSEWKNDNGSSPATMSVTKTIKLKHDGTVTFQNLPAGVTYTVTEKDYTSDGYDAANYTIDGTATGNDGKDAASKSMDKLAQNVIITNNKGTNVDTGVLLDSLPYILMLAFAVVGLAVFFVKRRTAREN